MKITTEFVPHGLRRLFTSGKEYKVSNPTERSLDWLVINDLGHSDFAQAVPDLVWEVVKVDFDITKHEWSDEDIEGCVINNEVVDIVELEIHYCRNMRLEKLDAIALAKHFKLTAEDLS